MLCILVFYVDRHILGIEAITSHTKEGRLMNQWRYSRTRTVPGFPARVGTGLGRRLLKILRVGAYLAGT